MSDHEMTGRRASDDIIIRVEQQMVDLLKAVNEIKNWLTGDGTKDNPGVMIRLDRLEQEENSRNQHRAILYTAIVGLLIERGWHYVTLLQSLKGHG